MQKRLIDKVVIVRRAPGAPTRGIIAAGPLAIPCALGRAGIATRKREGDGATPLASMRLLYTFRRKGRLAGLRTALPQHWTRAFDGWCDAPAHGAYNRPVRLPFPASAETLQRADRLYDFGVVTDFNMTSRKRGGGSAIFLHIAREGYAPTEGCVAVSPADMQRLRPWLRPGTRLIVRR